MTLLGLWKFAFFHCVTPQIIAGGQFAGGAFLRRFLSSLFIEYKGQERSNVDKDIRQPCSDGVAYSLQLRTVSFQQDEAMVLVYLVDITFLRPYKQRDRLAVAP